MTTPICDFVSRYAGEGTLRLHMPGHKGKSVLGFEDRDITEIKGADSLYEAEGIIAESEKNASEVFGCKTYYSTEGSSQCIRAMLYLVCLYAESLGRKPLIFAARNVHKTFLSAAALIGFDVKWLYRKNCNYLSSSPSEYMLDKALSSAEEKPVAVYVTSPDYLGEMADIRALSEACKKHGVLLIVDNAHGAYLKFMGESMHPIDLGADICCDSAHKTLSVLTGGAYLHISSYLPPLFEDNAKRALSLFGSTSPSYLILQSLDKANEYLASSYKVELADFVGRVRSIKEKLINHGYSLYGDEFLKITLCTKRYGYSGQEFADILRGNGIEPEFADPDFVCLMLTPSLDEKDLQKLCEVLLGIEMKPEITLGSPKIAAHEKVTDIRSAMLSLCETVPVEECVGRVLAEPSVGCPPAVPIVMCGERISENDKDAFLYYGIKQCSVIKE
ncbi:MAG: PLP-dependent transferase [Clostridia bacterium]|nr:PLP-dependent transferase [Clostridia bacterium]